MISIHQHSLLLGFEPTSAIDYATLKYLNLSVRLLSSKIHQRSMSPSSPECVPAMCLFDCSKLPYIQKAHINATRSQISFLVLSRTHVTELRETQISPPSHVTRARAEPTLRIHRSERNTPQSGTLQRKIQTFDNLPPLSPPLPDLIDLVDLVDLRILQSQKQEYKPTGSALAINHFGRVCKDAYALHKFSTYARMTISRSCLGTTECVL